MHYNNDIHGHFTGFTDIAGFVIVKSYCDWRRGKEGGEASELH